MAQTKTPPHKQTHRATCCTKEKNELRKERRQFLRDILLIVITNIFSITTTLLTTWLLMK